MGKLFFEYYDHMTSDEIVETINAVYKTKQNREALTMRYVDGLSYKRILKAIDKNYPIYEGSAFEIRKVEQLKRMFRRFERKASEWLNSK